MTRSEDGRPFPPGSRLIMRYLYDDCSVFLADADEPSERVYEYDLAGLVEHRTLLRVAATREDVACTISTGAFSQGAGVVRESLLATDSELPLFANGFE